MGYFWYMFCRNLEFFFFFCQILLYLGGVVYKFRFGSADRDDGAEFFFQDDFLFSSVVERGGIQNL